MSMTWLMVIDHDDEDEGDNNNGKYQPEQARSQRRPGTVAGGKDVEWFY